MRHLFAVVLVVHALIHLMGTAKVFGLAEISQLTHPHLAAGGLPVAPRRRCSSQRPSRSTRGGDGGGPLALARASCRKSSSPPHGATPVMVRSATSSYSPASRSGTSRRGPEAFARNSSATSRPGSGGTAVWRTGRWHALIGDHFRRLKGAPSTENPHRIPHKDPAAHFADGLTRAVIAPVLDVAALKPGGAAEV